MIKDHFRVSVDKRVTAVNFVVMKIADGRSPVLPGVIGSQVFVLRSPNQANPSIVGTGHVFVDRLDDLHETRIFALDLIAQPARFTIAFDRFGSVRGFTLYRRHDAAGRVVELIF